MKQKTPKQVYEAELKHRDRVIYVQSKKRTMQSIADEHGLTRQRVAQIIKAQAKP